MSSNFQNRRDEENIELNSLDDSYSPSLYRSRSKLVRPERSQLQRKRTLVANDSTRINENFHRNLPTPSNVSLEEEKQESGRLMEKFDLWKIWVLLVTCCVPNFCLKKFGKMSDNRVQYAWREKMALICIILLCCGFLAFFTFGLQASICDPILDRSPFNEPPDDNTWDIQGEWYFIDSNFMAQKHPQSLNTIFQMRNAGLFDISPYFQTVIPTPTCNAIQVTQPPTPDCQVGFGPTHCHLTVNFQDIQQTWTKISVSYEWQDILSLNNNFMVYNGIVLNMQPYLQGGVAFLGPEIHNLILDGIGRDVTRQFFHSSFRQQAAQCLVEKYKAGFLSKVSRGCFASSVINTLILILILSLIFIRLLLAIIYSSVVAPKLSRPTKGIPYLPPGVRLTPLNRKSKYSSVKNNILTPNAPVDDLMATYVMILVTCYSEDEAGIKCTLDSLASTQYNDKHKLIFIVADGLVTGGGNDRSTPDICLGLVHIPQEHANPAPKSYIAIAEGSKQHNMAKVYAGYYETSGHQVPVILVIKCGTPKEQKDPKPGNRGKRDSQIILMNFLSKIMFDDRMTALEYEIFTKIQAITGKTPDRYEILLTVDADSFVMPNALPLMINAMRNDIRIMGLCGETRISNKSANWVTMIQVYEYFISHHLAKNFESVFGGVTCLPGCFSAYRIKAPKLSGDKEQENDVWVPILACPEIIEEYSQNDVDTLHKKNLLLLGEDRFLTTLMLKTFPKRKMMFLPQAICKTEVPATFRVLLSQRRRWINSTVHNLLELILVRDLCGTFCFSMQFVVALELFGTVVLPAALIFTFILLISIIVPHQSFVRDSLMPLLILVMILLLPAVLIIFLSKRFSFIGWLLIYLLALPIWNFILPIYSYWHFDDFSWGKTRKVEGEIKDKGHVGNEGIFDTSQIELKLWRDWELEKRNHGRFSRRSSNPSEPSFQLQQKETQSKLEALVREKRKSLNLLESVIKEEEAVESDKENLNPNLDGYLSDFSSYSRPTAVYSDGYSTDPDPLSSTSQLKRERRKLATSSKKHLSNQ